MKLSTRDKELTTSAAVYSNLISQTTDTEATTKLINHITVNHITLTYHQHNVCLALNYATFGLNLLKIVANCDVILIIACCYLVQLQQ